MGVCLFVYVFCLGGGGGGGECVHAYVCVLIFLGVAQDVPFQDPVDEPQTSLSVLRNSRWPPRWLPFHVIGYNFHYIKPKMTILYLSVGFWCHITELNQLQLSILLKHLKFKVATNMASILV